MTGHADADMDRRVHIYRWRLLDHNRKDDGPRLSMSGAKTYRGCPAAYFYKYVGRMGDHRGAEWYMEFGSLIHEALSWVNDHYIEHGEYPREEDMVEAAYGMVVESKLLSVADRVRLGPVAHRVLSHYYKTVMRQVVPVLSEVPFLLESESGTRVYGIVDVSEADALWDYKVTARPVKLAEMHADQLNLYSVAFRMITGSWPSRVGVINLVRSAAPETHVRGMDLTGSNVQQTLDSLEAVWYDIQRRPFDPLPSSACGKCLFADHPCGAGAQYAKGAPASAVRG